MTKDGSPSGTASQRHGLYRFRLFVAGNEVNSQRAKETLFHLAGTYLADRHEIVVVDVMQDYQAALDSRIVVVPTLLVESPFERVIVGSLSDEKAVLDALGLAPERRPQ
ncbi:MAG TPA: circadian clock KaiB family protein [Syntrophobacteraceae bacterium]|nr:circadian clock KaiB family protein [Syntrophobacteraceae bacterium]